LRAKAASMREPAELPGAVQSPASSRARAIFFLVAALFGVGLLLASDGLHAGEQAADRR
jgi:hypothetical protein